MHSVNHEKNLDFKNRKKEELFSCFEFEVLVDCYDNLNEDGGCLNINYGQYL